MGDYSDNYTLFKGAYIYLGNKNQVVDFKPFIKNLSYSRKVNGVENENFFGALKLADGSKMSVKFDFSVVAANVKEAVDNHVKFQKLIRMIMPLKSAAPGEGVKNVCQIYVKFSNLVHNGAPRSYNQYSFEQLLEDGLLCNVPNIQYKPDIEMGFFETKSGKLVGKAFEISLDLDVVNPNNESNVKVVKEKRSKRNRPGNMFGFEIKYE